VMLRLLTSGGSSRKWASACFTRPAGHKLCMRNRSCMMKNLLKDVHPSWKPFIRKERFFPLVETSCTYCGWTPLSLVPLSHKEPDLSLFQVEYDHYGLPSLGCCYCKNQGGEWGAQVRTYALSAKGLKGYSIVDETSVWPVGYDLFDDKCDDSEDVKRSRIGIPKRMRSDVLQAKGTRCFYCGVQCDVISGSGEKSKLHMDHVIPVCWGGTNSFDNLIPACGYCNKHKHSRLAVEFRYILAVSRSPGRFSFWAEEEGLWSLV
jgi:hypothetical protein